MYIFTCVHEQRCLFIQHTHTYISILFRHIKFHVCILLGYYRRDHQGQGLEERELASLRAQQRELERSIEIRHIDRQNSLSSPLLSSKVEKKIRRKSREKKGRGVRDDRQKAYNTELDDFQENLRQDVMDTVNFSIQEMTAQLGASFGVHSAQLREGFENLSEFILERSHIQTSPSRSGTPPSGSRSRSLNNSMEMNSGIPQSDHLGQTHGRSRGSLVHPGGSAGGRICSGMSMRDVMVDIERVLGVICLVVPPRGIVRIGCTVMAIMTEKITLMLVKVQNFLLRTGGIVYLRIMREGICYRRRRWQC